MPLIELRDYQQSIWDEWFHKRLTLKIRNMKMSQQWHRRAGKDLFDLNIMIAETMIELGNYWFILPEAQQIRNAIWEGITSEGVKYLDFIPDQLVNKWDNQSMKIYLKNPKLNNKTVSTNAQPTSRLDTGSIMSFVGGDRYDKRVGAGLKGAVISEHSLQKPNLYDLAVEPMLKETGGWCIFNFTPRGENHATKMHDFLEEDEKYIASTLTIKDTKVVDEADLAEERKRGKPEELIQQEYYCSREGANFGSYYGDLLSQYKKHVGEYAYDAGYPVHTLWDLGISDQMAIWFVQFIQKNMHFIDYYENSNYALGHYASVLQGKGYMYAMHHLPHDGAKRQLTTAEKAISIESQLKNLGVRPTKIHVRTHNVYAEIQRVRSFLSRCYFNKETTGEGYEALKQYQREFDEGRQVFKTTPLHNWASNGADAFRILPLIEGSQNMSPTSRAKPFKGSIRIRV